MSGRDSSTQFKDPLRARRETHPAGPHLRADAQHARLPVDEYDVDRVAHAYRVDARARRDQQALGGAQGRAHEQAQGPCNESVGNPYPQPPRGRRAMPEACHHSPDFISWVTIGKPITMKVHGKMQIIRGPSIFTGASSASFSAR